MSKEHLERYFHLLQDGSSELNDFSWLKETLECHSELARLRLPNGELPLRVLLDQGKAGLFSLLAKHNAEHDVITASAATALETVEQLLNANPNLVQETDTDANTPLHWACVEKYSKRPYDSVGLINLLVATGACIEAENRFGETPLDRAVLTWNGDAALELLERGAKPNVRYAIAAEDFELLDDLLADDPAQVRWQDRRNGQTLLHLAIQWDCDSNVFDYLIANGAREQLEMRSGSTARTPLLLAITSRNYDLAEALIRHGANVNVREQREQSQIRNKSALEMAVCDDRVGLAEMLISHGADIYEYHVQGDRSLLCDVKSSEMAELLISAGVGQQESDVFEKALAYAVEDGRRDVVATLVRYGAKPTTFAHVVLGDREQLNKMLDHNSGLISAVNISPFAPPEPDPDEKEDGVEIPWGSAGGTALHYAAKTGVLSVVNLLIDRGADVNAITQQAWTPLHDATYYTIRHDLREGTAIIRTLVAAGADLNAETSGGYRPLDIADYLSFDDRSCDVFDLLAELGMQT